MASLCTLIKQEKSQTATCHWQEYCKEEAQVCVLLLTVRAKTDQAEDSSQQKAQTHNIKEHWTREVILV